MVLVTGLWDRAEASPSCAEQRRTRVSQSLVSVYMVSVEDLRTKATQRINVALTFPLRSASAVIRMTLMGASGGPDPECAPSNRSVPLQRRLSRLPTPHA